MTSSSAQTENDQILARKNKLEQIKTLQGGAYPNGMALPQPTAPICEEFHETTSEALTAENKQVRIAGRVVFLRDFGKGAFWKCRDESGVLQIFISKKELEEIAFELAKCVDPGDLVWVEGILFRTQKGELSIKAKKLMVLAKCLRPLPEKYHGLTDVEQRYRKRYLDLIMSPASYQTFLKRSQIVSQVRKFFEALNFLEVETPMMQSVPSGALARPFKTHHNALDKDLFLRVAPELYLKRLVVGGYPRVFELNRNFRNEGVSTEHNPEFTMLEFYQAYATYEDFIQLIETLFSDIATTLHHSTEVTFGEKSLSFKAPFQRLHMFQALSEKIKTSVDDLFDRKKMEKIGKQLNVQVQPYQTGAEISVNLFESLFEPEMQQPTFVMGYPVDVSPLARRQPSDPRFTDRFELFVAGTEVANGFSELNDPEDQLNRFEEQQRARESGHEEALLIDHDYVEALSYGMPPTAGAGIGIDRLAMVMLNQHTIRDVILFPTLR
jgi:lysyl-tRNA synthetase, class II